jgi:excinuclease ABC subunit A
VIDMGPGPGERGGTIIFDGVPEDIRSSGTLTGEYLGGHRHVADVSLWSSRPVTKETPRIVLEGASQHNLQDVTVEIPLQRLVCVTGVSGSGKSTLIQDVLYPALARHLGVATESPGAFQRLLGADQVNEVVFVDQSPIGKTARSNPASYVGAFDEIRKLFAKVPLAQQRGYGPGMFSFNSGDGRCPTCGGSGFEHIEMQFLSDVYLRCPDCDGRRYRAELLEVKIERGTPARALSIADVLELTVSEATAYFAGDAEVLRVLKPIVDVGLEYVKLGQPVPTLSGGEAQRLKLAAELTAGAAHEPTVYVLDEPTTGLHLSDVRRLLGVLHKLVDRGDTLVVIEHHTDVIASADWVVELGPEAGERGGRIVFEGEPRKLAHAKTATGKVMGTREPASPLQPMAS